MRTVFVGLGLIAFLVGLVWILQGADILVGSVMSGSSFWLAAGIILVLVGLGVGVWGVRAPSTKKSA